MRRRLSVCVLVGGLLGLAATAEAQYPQVSIYCVSGSSWVPCQDPGTGTTQGSASGGTAGTESQLIGGIYSATLPTLTDGQQAGARLGVNGNLNVNLYAQNSGGTWTAVQAGADPCSGSAKSIHVINTSTATTVEIANAVASQYFYICSINIVVAGAQTVAIVEDDTDGVGSPTAGLHGGTSASTGWSFAANGGISLGNGNGTVMRTGTANRYLGIITGSAVQTSGTITYVSAP